MAKKQRPLSGLSSEVTASMERRWNTNYDIINEFELTGLHKEFLECVLNTDNNLSIVNGPAGSAKAQPLDSLLMTPQGWVRMGDIKVGDLVYSSDGETTEVTGVFPQGKKDIFEVIFSDGTSTRCCGDHLWYTETYNDRHARRRGSVKSTIDIKNTLTVTKKNKAVNHSIPITSPVKFNEVDHIIHPYIIGTIIGDGCMVQQPVLTSADEEIIEKVRNHIPDSLLIEHRIKYDYVIKNSSKSLTRNNILTDELRRLNLWGCKSSNKFIPDEYLFDSIDNRVELLRGLMDTDGSVFNESVTFCTTSIQLANDVRNLIESLGGICTLNSTEPFYTYNDKKRLGQTCYRLTINLENYNPFYLKRKRDRVKSRKKYHPIRYIKEINYIGEDFCQCIMVNHPSHLYLTNNYIVTHNTYVAVLAALLSLRKNLVEEIVYIRSVVESASSKLGHLPGDINEKFHPWSMPLLDKLNEILSPGDAKHIMTTGIINCVPVNLVRGLTFKNSIVIVDECQNMTKSELITVLTRFGLGSKYVLLGDCKQSDIGSKSGYSEVYDIFDDEESKDMGIHTFTFTSAEIVRHPLLSFICDKLDS